MLTIARKEITIVAMPIALKRASLS
jgi:hypothetical protein